MQKIKKYIPAILFFTPFFALAVSNIPELINLFVNLFNQIAYLLIAAAVVIFLYGVVQYITAGGNEEKRTEARNTIIWGIVSLFVMIAMWGFVRLLQNTFQLDIESPFSPYL